jgi:hypothetical protein
MLPPLLLASAIELVENKATNDPASMARVANVAFMGTPLGGSPITTRC